MTLRRRSKSGLTLAGLALAAALVLPLASSRSAPGLVVSAQGTPAPTIGGYQKISETRVTRTVFDYVYRATLTNVGPALPGATATVASLSSSTTVIDNSLTYAPVGPGGNTLSTDTFAFRQDRGA